MKHKKLFILTFLTVLSCSFIAWKIGAAINHYRGSKGVRFCDDCSIQALLQGKSPQQELSLIPEEATEKNTLNNNETDASAPQGSKDSEKIEGMIDHR